MPTTARTPRRRPARPPLPVKPDAVLTVPQWAGLVGIGYSTAKDLIHKGKGPKVTRLSAKRVGVRVSHHHEWLNSRRDIR